MLTFSVGELAMIVLGSFFVGAASLMVISLICSKNDKE